MNPGIDAILNRARKVRDDLALPEAAKAESRRDKRAAELSDPGKFEYLSWACKFLIDANILEKEISASAGGAGA